MSNIRIELAEAAPLPRPFEQMEPEDVRDMAGAAGLFERFPKIVFLSGYTGAQVNPVLGDFVFNCQALYELTPRAVTLYRPAIFRGSLLAALGSHRARVRPPAARRDRHVRQVGPVGALERRLARLRLPRAQRLHRGRRPVTPVLRPLLDRLAGRAGSSMGLPAEWRVSWSSWESSSVGVRDGQRASVHAPLALGRGFGFDYLFVWEDGRISTGAAERIAIADPDRFLDLARQAAYEDPDGANIAGPARFEEVPLVSEETASDARTGGGVHFAALLETGEAPVTARGFKTWSGSVSASATQRGVLTSRGLDVHSASTHASYSFWYEGLTGDSHGSRSPVPGAEAAARLDRACDLVQRLGSPEPGFEGGTMPVLLHPKVVESFLSTYLLSNLHGDRIHHGQSAFRMEQFGSQECVFAPSLSLRLEPSVPMDTGSYRFTTEGVPARTLGYVESGRLIEPILDLKYARRLGRAPVPGPLSSDSLRLTGGSAIGRRRSARRRRPRSPGPLGARSAHAGHDARRLLGLRAANARDPRRPARRRGEGGPHGELLRGAARSASGARRVRGLPDARPPLHRLRRRRLQRLVSLAS